MKYIFAFDGGGTKTRMNVADLEGNILYDKIDDGSNIASSGNKKFKELIGGLYEVAIKELNIEKTEIAHIYLGLSGADLESDYARLNLVCAEIFDKLPFTVMNDAWIILRSGLKENYGAVCICGTGTNSAAVNREGKRAILRSLGYTLGIYGGGLDIAREALHHAFRAEELTYEDTMLRYEIPKLLGKKDMDDVVSLFYPTYNIDKFELGKITGLVDYCASQGDAVSIMILEKVAYHLALQTVGVIRQVKMEDEIFPVVVGGRVFSMQSQYLMNKFKMTIKEQVPMMHIVMPLFTPVVGAYLSALDILGIEQNETIERNLLDSGGNL